jgi:hypothetical protein
LSYIVKLPLFSLIKIPSTTREPHHPTRTVLLSKLRRGCRVKKILNPERRGAGISVFLFDSNGAQPFAETSERVDIHKSWLYASAFLLRRSKRSVSIAIEFLFLMI